MRGVLERGEGEIWCVYYEVMMCWIKSLLSAFLLEHKAYLNFGRSVLFCKTNVVKCIAIMVQKSVKVHF